MLGQEIVTVAHEVNKNVQEMDAVKNNGLVLDVLL